MSDCIVTSGLHYKIDKKEILKDISFSIKKGDVFAILGHNGAGKTTLFELLANVIRPSKGFVNYYGQSQFDDIKEKVGVLWDNLTIFPLLKVKEVINYTKSLQQLKGYSSKYYDCLGLQQYSERQMQKLSRGEKKKVEILLALMHEPEILIMDEPTGEIDPLSRNLIWESVFLQNNRTVIFSTHQWEEAERYANKVSFIDKGKIINEPMHPKELISNSGFKNKLVVNANSLTEIPLNVFNYQTKDNIVILLKEKENGLIEEIKKQTLNYSILPIQLEDVFNSYLKS